MELYRDKIEEYGNYYEKQGFPPVASRVLIYLLLREEAEATFEDIVDYFNVSKSAVSNALKLLTLMEIISERTKAGARKRYFRIRLGHLFSPEKLVKSYQDTRLILEDIRQLRMRNDDFSGEIDEIVTIMKVLEQEYPRIYERIRSERAEKGNANPSG